MVCDEGDIGEVCPFEFDRGGEMGDIVRELVREWSERWARPPVAAKVGCALRPTAQSGRGGKGCCDDVVDVYVRLEEEEVVEEVEETSSQFEDDRLLPPELLFPEVRRLELSLGPTASPT